MEFNLKFIPDKNYYKEAYDEMVSSMKYKKYVPYFASALIFVGIVFYFLDKSGVIGILPFLFICSGLFEFFKFYNEKRKWIKDRFDSRILGKEIQIEFTDEMIKINGPFSNGELKWFGLKKIVKTKQGILLKPENGLSIYLQDKIFSSYEQIEFVLSKGN